MIIFISLRCGMNCEERNHKHGKRPKMPVIREHLRGKSKAEKEVLEAFYIVTSVTTAFYIVSLSDKEVRFLKCTVSGDYV